MSGALPPLYRRWIEQLLGRPIPTEKKAMCSKYAMVLAAGDAGNPDQRYFTPVTRCSDRHPEPRTDHPGGHLPASVRPAVASRGAGAAARGSGAYAQRLPDPARRFGRTDRKLRIAGDNGVWK